MATPDPEFLPAFRRRLRRGAVALGLAWTLFGVVACTAVAQDGTPDLVYISNVTGVGDGSNPGTVEEQTRRMLDRLGDRLAEEGLDLGDVAVSNVFLKDTRHFQAMNEIYRSYFTTDPPTRATVESDLPDPAALIQISVVATRGPREVVIPSGLRSPELPYSWGIRTGSTLFISGATSRNPDTYQPVTGDVETQTRRVMGNVGLVLEEAGMDFGDVTACRVFMDDPRDFGAMNRAYREVMPEVAPGTRATVRAGLMNPVFLVEIQCVADDAPGRRVVQMEGAGPSTLPFSPGIAAGERLYLSGMVGQGADVPEQTRSVLDRLEATLRAGGKGFGDAEDVWVYVTDVRDLSAVREVLDEVLPAGGPEPTVIGAPLMGPRLLVEISVTAR